MAGTSNARFVAVSRLDHPSTMIAAWMMEKPMSIEATARSLLLSMPMARERATPTHQANVDSRKSRITAQLLYRLGADDISRRRSGRTGLRADGWRVAERVTIGRMEFDGGDEGVAVPTPRQVIADMVDALSESRSLRIRLGSLSGRVLGWGFGLLGLPDASGPPIAGL